jgi:hypothetical protein
MEHEMLDKPSKSCVIESDVKEDQLPTPEQRKELRRATLRFARLLPPGADRNELRRIARSLAFFEEATTSAPVKKTWPAARPRVANVELLRRW